VPGKIVNHFLGDKRSGLVLRGGEVIGDFFGVKGSAMEWRGRPIVSRLKGEYLGDG